MLESGSYTGALNLDYREFARLYQYVSSLGERYRHRCYLVLVIMGAKLDQTMYIDHIDKAMECMEKAIRQNIRKNGSKKGCQVSRHPFSIAFRGCDGYNNVI